MNDGKHNGLLEDTLKDLELKDQQIMELNALIETLQMGAKKGGNQNGVSLSEFKDENARLSQRINELEIDLMREKNSKETVQEKLVELQLIYSEVASQRVIGDPSEMEDLRRLSSLNLDVEFHIFFVKVCHLQIVF